jgi:hypothetical protein
LASGVHNNKTYYYVKWAGLQHAECTWECEDDINDDFQITKYKNRQIRPSPEMCQNLPKPAASEFSVYKNVPYHTYVIRIYFVIILNINSF